MSDNTAYYDTIRHTHVTCADESQYEDVNKLWGGVYNYNNNTAADIVKLYLN